MGADRSDAGRGGFLADDEGAERTARRAFSSVTPTPLRITSEMEPVTRAVMIGLVHGWTA
jgi:hypothetical protein